MQVYIELCRVASRSNTPRENENLLIDKVGNDEQRWQLVSLVELKFNWNYINYVLGVSVLFVLMKNKTHANQTNKKYCEL